MQLINRRLVGKDGSDRIRELRAILSELPNYRNGPYADIRKWVNAQIDLTRSRGRTLSRDSIEIRRQGAAQVAVVGPPNVGKSTLLQALSDIQIRTGDFPFTTLRPVAAVTRIEGVEIQLVEIPGLIEDAHQGRGGGRALLGVLRHADAMVLCHDARRPTSELEVVRRELAEAGIELPTLVAATRCDEAEDLDPPGLAAELGLPVLAVSVLDDQSLDELRAKVWELTGLIRIFLRKDGVTDDRPLACAPSVTVAEIADDIHHHLGAACSGAHIWGPSARFPGQLVGRSHPLADGDEVEIVS
jgi:uncharacterized protein